MHIIVTAGGTREPIDAVRFIANASTGLLGAWIALTAARRGHEVALIHAEGIALPPGWADGSGSVRMIEFVTARDLGRALAREVPLLADPSAVVMAAAVADFAPVPVEGKISSEADELVLRLKKVDKIVDKVKTWNANVLLVKFKLESNRSREELVDIGRESARKSAADLMVLNDTEAMRGGRHSAVLFRPESGRLEDVECKEAIAAAVVDALEERAGMKAGER
jgi:phosphopantothenoylcysteine decarboxylase/phosphopantothenate--cysteine ligase